MRDGADDPPGCMHPAGNGPEARHAFDGEAEAALSGPPLDALLPVFATGGTAFQPWAVPTARPARGR